MADRLTSFDKLTPIHPRERITLEIGAQPLAPRILDLFVPLGFGQRALVVAPPQAGKTTILRQVAQSVLTKYPEAYLFLCLVDERPEEVTDWRAEVRGERVRYYTSSFDQQITRHGRIVEQALTEARRTVERGADVILLLDSLTRLARVHNLTTEMWSGGRGGRGGGFGSRTLSGGIDAHALEVGRRVFGAARALEEGGSLTIVATCLIETGSRLDEVVYEEFKGTGNLEVQLSRELANQRIFPALDLPASSTRQEERLLSADELKAMALMRRRMSNLSKRDAVEQVLQLFEKTQSNQQLVEAILQQW